MSWRLPQSGSRLSLAQSIPGLWLLRLALHRQVALTWRLAAVLHSKQGGATFQPRDQDSTPDQPHAPTLPVLVHQPGCPAIQVSGRLAGNALTCAGLPWPIPDVPLRV